MKKMLEAAFVQKSLEMDDAMAKYDELKAATDKHFKDSAKAMMIAFGLQVVLVLLVWTAKFPSGVVWIGTFAMFVQIAASQIQFRKLTKRRTAALDRCTKLLDEMKELHGKIEMNSVPEKERAQLWN